MSNVKYRAQRGANQPDRSVEAVDKAAIKNQPVPDRSNPDLSSFYTSYIDTLTGALRRTFGDGPPDPHDVAQEAFQRLIERGSLSSVSNLKAFVWQIARNLVLMEKRGRSTRSRYDFEVEHVFFAHHSADLTPESIVIAREQLTAVNHVLRHMPEKRRRAILLHHIDGLSITEVGRRLGVGPTAAKKHIMRAMCDIDAYLAASRRDHEREG